MAENASAKLREELGMTGSCTCQDTRARAMAALHGTDERASCDDPACRSAAAKDSKRDSENDDGQSYTLGNDSALLQDVRQSLGIDAAETNDGWE